jgi:hypothetical protein
MVSERDMLRVISFVLEGSKVLSLTGQREPTIPYHCHGVFLPFGADGHLSLLSSAVSERFGGTFVS